MSDDNVTTQEEHGMKIHPAMSEKLPYLCPEHPAAQIRHEWLRTRKTSRLTGASLEYNEDGTDRYYCATCGRELAAENTDD